MRPSTGTGSSDVLDEMCPATFHSPLHRPKTLNYLKPHRSKPSGLLHCSERGMRLHSGKRGSLQTCLWARACRSGGLGFPISVICPSPFSLACDSGLCGEGGGRGQTRASCRKGVVGLLVAGTNHPVGLGVLRWGRLEHSAGCCQNEAMRRLRPSQNTAREEATCTHHPVVFSLPEC